MADSVVSDDKKEDKILTKEMIAEFKEVFSIFDENGDGGIKLKDVKNVLVCLGQKPSNKELEEMLHEMDIDGNGLIQFSEFLILVEKKMKQANDSDKHGEVFKLFDKDGRGFISARDLEYVMINLGEKLTSDELEEMVNMADTTGDGHITYTEFVTMMNTL